jgi:DNA primase
MILQASIDEVMGRANIVDVIGQFVRLKRRGTNYIANCPFHNEKSPSFNVSASKGIYKCFGCGKAGNVVSFVQEHEKLTYPEAIKWLADYYKITIEETQRTPEQKQQQQEGEALRLLNEYAAKYFNEVLLNDEEGKLIGLSYLKQRGLTKEVIERFRLGYSLDKEGAFYQTALSKGYSVSLLEKADLVKNRSGIYHDAYRGRIIFPIQNMTGRIVGFGARIIKSNDRAPKYINTKENELYIKSKTLYGIYQSRQAIAKQDECYLVEGYTDVISLHQGGVEHVIASSGTSLTDDQLRLIGQLTKNLTILYDGDPAGVKAALRGLDMALSQSFNVKLVLLPDKEDPDSYIQKVGAIAFNDYVKAHKQDVISFRMQVGVAEAGDDPVKRSKLVNEIAESISKINKAEDFSLQDYYIRQAANKLQVDQAGLVNLVNKHIRERIEQDAKQQRKEEAIPAADPEAAEIEQTLDELPVNTQQEWQLLRVLIEYGAMTYEGHACVADMVDGKIDRDLIEDDRIRQLFEEYFAQYLVIGPAATQQYFMNHPDDEVRKTMAGLLLGEPEISPKWKEKYGIERLSGPLLYLNDLESTLAYFEYKKLLQMQEQLMERLKNGSDEQTILKVQVNYLKLRELEKEMLQKHHTVVFKSLKFQITRGKNTGT